MSRRHPAHWAPYLMTAMASLFPSGRPHGSGLRLAVIMLVLACYLLPGCRTIESANEPANPTLAALQAAATPEPLDRVSPASEQRHAKQAMVRWTEQFLGHAYRVTDQRFVLLEPGFTAGAQIGSKAQQYVTRQLGGSLKTDGWFDDDAYMLLLWQLPEGSPRYIAFVMTRDPLPGTNERRLVGYFALEPTTADTKNHSTQAPVPSRAGDITDRSHPGNERFLQAIDAIQRSPNIPPGTFTGDRLAQSAANLANASLAGAQRPQGGQNEALDRIDFVVFNTQRHGLVAGQGTLGDPAAKLALLPAAQDNATSLTAASQQVSDTMQRTQAQAMAAAEQTQQQTQDVGVRSIGGRLW